MKNTRKKIEEIENIILVHDAEKWGRSLACDLPIDEEIAQKLALQLHGDDAAIGALGAWVTILLDTVNDTFEQISKNTSSEEPRACLLNALDVSMQHLKEHVDAIIQALGAPAPANPAARIEGATAGPLQYPSPALTNKESDSSEEFSSLPG